MSACPGQPIVFRMTGCPNGCARPYVAEVALVGRSLDKYMLYLGGDVAGTRLARPFLDLVPLGVGGTHAEAAVRALPRPAPGRPRTSATSAIASAWTR